MPSLESEALDEDEAGEGEAGATDFWSAVCQLQRETERHSVSAIIPTVFIRMPFVKVAVLAFQQY